MAKKDIDSKITEDTDLDDILNSLAPTTPRMNHKVVQEAVQTEIEQIDKIVATPKLKASKAKITAYISTDLKREVGLYLFNHPQENERSLILKGLKMLGFNVSENELIDGRRLKK